MSPSPFPLLLVLFFCGACHHSTSDRQVPADSSLLTGRQDSLPAYEREDEVLGLNEAWTGDLDTMVERRIIRALVPYNRTNYYIDGKERRGISYEAMIYFEKELNKQLGKKGKVPYVRVVFIPITRDRLLPALREGRGDLVAATLAITPKRRELADFSLPVARGTREVVVTGPGHPPLSSFDALIGQTIHVRKTSSYYEHLEAINDSLRSIGKGEIHIQPVDEYLEDDEVLEMVNSGLIPITVVDKYLAGLWVQVLDSIRVHHELAVFEGGDIAWAVRKDSPKLKALLDDFIHKNRQGTLLGNMLINKYFKDGTYVKNALSADGREKFLEMRDFFVKYAELYSLDWLLLAAQAYQESQFDQNQISPAGAVGVMQIKPKTASDPNIGIDNIYTLENNIHAGAKYLRFLADRYFPDDDIDPLNKELFTIASYNAGPARVRQLRQRAASYGLDPNLWFDNVEMIAARDIGRETVQYVSNIYKYYTSFRSLNRYAQVTGKNLLEQ